MPASIYTLGYEGIEIGAFVDAVGDLPISHLVDIRWTPISRKRGFSKRLLAEYLERHGVQYLHMPGLGSPKPMRDTLRTTRDWRAFAAQYDVWLHHQEESIRVLGDLAHRRTIGLLCFEADVHRCHRSLLMRELMAGPLGGFEWHDWSKSGLRPLTSWWSSSPILAPA